MSFETKAEKKNVKQKVVLAGPAGSGKTYTALLIATKFLKGKKVAVIDSEKGRSERYAGTFDFVVEKPLKFDLRGYIAMVEAAAKAGVDVLILDSFSHVWNGEGGALEQVDMLGGNKFSNGWKTVTPLYNELIRKLQTYPGHVIVTMRVKTEYVVETNDQGKAVPRKIGTKPIHREDADYEFDFVLNLAQGGGIHVIKQCNCPKLEDFSGTRKDLEMIVNEIVNS